MASNAVGDVRIDGGSDGIADLVANDPGSDERPLAIGHVVGHVHIVTTLYDVNLRTNATTSDVVRNISKQWRSKVLMGPGSTVIWGKGVDLTGLLGGHKSRPGV